MYRLTLILSFMFIAGGVHADDLLYRYEGDVAPDEPSAGWTIFNPCEGACSSSLQDGHFVLTWQDGGDNVNYHMRISTDAGVPPPPRHSGWSGTSARISR